MKWLRVLSSLLIVAAIIIAAHQLVVWRYWNWEQQFLPYHHEGLSLKFLISGIAIRVFNRKSKGTT